MKTVVYYLMVGILLIPTISISQEKLVLTLDQSVELAFKHNPEIKMAEKEVAKAKADVGEAYSSILPQLDANASFLHNWKIQSQTIPNFLKPMLGPLAPPGMPDFVKLVQDGINIGEFGQSADPELAAEIFLGTITHYLWKQINCNKTILSDQLAEEIVELLFKGLNE